MMILLTLFDITSFLTDFIVATRHYDRFAITLCLL